MRKKSIPYFKCIFIFIILFIIIFHNKTVIAVNSLKDSKFKLTYYSDVATDYRSLGNSGITSDKLTVNVEHRWYEYEKDGQKYVVIAAATEEYLEANNLEKKDHIHYFKYYDTIKFSFEDEKFDNKEYYGIILDSCEASVEDVKEGDEQILDIYVEGKEENLPYQELFNQKIVMISDDSEYSESAGKSSSSKNDDFWIEFGMYVFRGLGDLVESFINDLANNIKSPKTLDLTTSRAKIEINDQINNLIQFSSYNENIETNALAEIYVLKEKSYRYAYTHIPLTYVDIYSSSINMFPILNINFLDNSYNNPVNAWNLIRKICLASSRIVLYIATALLTTMTMWRAIIYINATRGDNPAEARDSIEIINRVVKAIAMLVGIYIIIALTINFYDVILKLILNGNNSPFLLRIKVANVCEFNTNFIGYLKFLSMSSDLWEAFGYSFLYCVLSIINAFWFVFIMMLRMIVIAILIIIAPLTSVTTMLEKNEVEGVHATNILHFRSWIKMFMFWVWSPLAAVIILRTILLFI